ncbi:hypothetical protein JW899_00015 [Candidatus Uhrbacteria bacterium]|nr:hypothetical protein [Candidatus Uhrbacteria bacterium]
MGEWLLVKDPSGEEVQYYESGIYSVSEETCEFFRKEGRHDFVFLREENWLFPKTGMTKKTRIFRCSVCGKTCPVGERYPDRA